MEKKGANGRTKDGSNLLASAPGMGSKTKGVRRSQRASKVLGVLIVSKWAGGETRSNGNGMVNEAVTVLGTCRSKRGQEELGVLGQGHDPLVARYKASMPT
jgi:hypothetical protein